MKKKPTHMRAEGQDQYGKEVVRALCKDTGPLTPYREAVTCAKCLAELKRLSK
jgi:hypothetical protein